MLYIRNPSIEKCSDECDKCVGRICCVVFLICSPQKGVVKERNVRCEHLAPDGQCGIYKNRANYPGYSEACMDFSCDNAGPILGEWLEKNRIPLESSTYIGALLRMIRRFITTGSRRNERSNFLRAIVFDRCTDIDSFLDYFEQPHYIIAAEFNKWAQEYPEDPEFDRQLQILFAHERL